MKRSIFAIFLMLCGVAPSFAQNHNFETTKQLDIFNSIVRELDLYYVDTLDVKKVMENTINYMLSQLDPYTQYYEEDDTDDLRVLSTGKYGGIGSPIVFRKDLDRAVFSDPYSDMPAAVAGVRSGDRILAIDGKPVGSCGDRDSRDFLSDITSQLRGEPGTIVEVKVQRPGREKPLLFKITRQQVKRPSVVWQQMCGNDIGYVLLDGYTEDTSKDLRSSIAVLKQQGAEKLVLDLRGNGGGLLQQAIEVVNFFIPRGQEVVSTRGKVREFNHVYKTEAEPLDLDMPVVVMVNYGTASAAEITCGALQDYDRAVIVGSRTYGKGLVQQPRQLPYETMMKMTTAKYYIPSGRCIQAYDFKHRGADGQPMHMPDSLCKDFTTVAGRVVRDGGGITPDVVTKADTLPDFVGYMELSNAFFDWCVEYRNSHETIASPTEFSVTDEELQSLKEYLIKKDFDHGIATAFDSCKKYVRLATETQLLSNYYSEGAVIQHSLLDDPELEEALAVLRDPERYRAILKK